MRKPPFRAPITIIRDSNVNRNRDYFQRSKSIPVYQVYKRKSNFCFMDGTETISANSKQKPLTVSVHSTFTSSFLVIKSVSSRLDFRFLLNHCNKFVTCICVPVSIYHEFIRIPTKWDPKFTKARDIPSVIVLFINALNW